MAPDRIRLVNCDKKIINCILADDGSLSTLLQINVPAVWTEFGAPAFQYSLNAIEENPAAQKWYTYLPILKASNTLIGSCGYKGMPDKKGIVEIGYEVAANYRNRGYATEITQLLIAKAFSENMVSTVQAHTLAEENASVKVLKKCGFQFMEEIQDDEEENIWKWELSKYKLRQ